MHVKCLLSFKSESLFRWMISINTLKNNKLLLYWVIKFCFKTYLFELFYLNKGQLGLVCIIYSTIFFATIWNHRIPNEGRARDAMASTIFLISYFARDVYWKFAFVPFSKASQTFLFPAPSESYCGSWATLIKASAASDSKLTLCVILVLFAF